MKTALAMVLLCLGSLVQAVELAPRRVAENVYALIGPTAGRTHDNYGLNANFGFVVAEEGVLLIDSGAAHQAARVLENAIRRVTSKPVRWVINTGSQDHRWLGNGYFREKGAQIIALERTVRTQRELADRQLTALQPVLKERLAGTRPVYAGNPLPGNGAKLRLGAVAVEMHWFGDAHFAGDVVVWLPQQRVLFSGDLIYADRMLSVLPESRVDSWLAALEATLEALQPAIIVPGHGSVCDSGKARQDTGAYLAWLQSEIKPAAERWDGLDATVTKYGNEARWRHLENFGLLHRGNINRSYVQFENGETGEVPAR